MTDVLLPRPAARKPFQKPPSGRTCVKVTGASTMADDFNRLFTLRSDFVHGKYVDIIPPNERILARSLTREVFNRLVDAAIAEAGVGREQYLERLCP